MREESPPNGEGALAGAPRKAESKSKQQLPQETGSDKQIVRLPLSAEQARQLAPVVHRAAEQHENVIFFAVAIPFWSLHEQSVVWELQVTTIPARLAEKVKKLVLGSKPV
jgi:hypothetical protein